MMLRFPPTFHTILTFCFTTLHPAALPAPTADRDDDNDQWTIMIMANGY